MQAKGLLIGFLAPDIIIGAIRYRATTTTIFDVSWGVK